MREILFRGKDRFDGEWYVGSLTHDRKYGNCFIEVCVHQGITKEVIPETVGQYTGLKDKNGTRVFEGDILSGYLDELFPEEESRYEVIWHDYGWHIRSNGLLDTPDNDWLKENFEVIGNIHDNPELLEVKQ